MYCKRGWGETNSLRDCIPRGRNGALDIQLFDCESKIFNLFKKYIGNQAKQQLVKNAKNTITGFRNLLGKSWSLHNIILSGFYQRSFSRFSEIPQAENITSAPVIQQPDFPDTPAYKVQVLQPSPSPLPAGSNVTSTFTTPAASHAPTPRSEPVPVDRILTVSEVNTIFLKSLIQSAEDFLGKQVTGTVISVPSTLTDVQKDALEKAASDAGVQVLQLLDEAGAAAATTTRMDSSLTLDPPPSR